MHCSTDRLLTKKIKCELHGPIWFFAINETLHENFIDLRNAKMISGFLSVPLFQTIFSIQKYSWSSSTIFAADIL